MISRLIRFWPLILVMGILGFAGYSANVSMLTTEEMRTDKLVVPIPAGNQLQSPGLVDIPLPGTRATLKPGTRYAPKAGGVKDGDLDTFTYHNGTPSGGLSGYKKDCIEAVEFFTYYPIKLLRIRFYTTGAPGPMRLAFYPSYGGSLPDIQNPLFPGLVLRATPSGNGVWTEVDLESYNLRIPEPGIFWFGHWKLAGTPTINLDTSADSVTHSYIYVAKDSFPWDDFYVIGSDLSHLSEYLVELDVEYYNVRDSFTFTEITSLVGITSGGSRMAWGDYNNDGYDDILASGRFLFRNNGDGTFTDVSAAMGLSGLTATNGGVWADYDNDGWLDFYAHTGGTTTRDYLMHNEGGLMFTDKTSFAGIGDTWKTEAAAWADYDNDGYVDLYVANYEDCERCPKVTPPADPCAESSANCWLAWGDPDILWHNNGDGTFTDVSATAGIDAAQYLPFGDAHCGRGVNWGDFDNDGDQDLFVSNYRLDPDLLFVNNGDGTFTELSATKGVKGVNNGGAYGHTIGSTWGDFDNDGDLDLFCANLAHPRFINFSDKSMLYENSGPPDYTFTDIREAAGIMYEETHSDSSFADFDNDGWLDLFVTSVYTGRKSTFYRNNGDKTFTFINYESGVIIDGGWGFSWADYDNDGFLDILNRSGIFHRNHGNDNNWITVRARGTVSNWASIGARVTVTAGGLTQIREIQGGEGTSHQNPLYAHFGLGTVTNVDNLTVTWPSGRNLVLNNVPVNQVLVVTEP